MMALVDMSDIDFDLWYRQWYGDQLEKQDKHLSENFSNLSKTERNEV